MASVGVVLANDEECSEPVGVMERWGPIRMWWGELPVVVVVVLAIEMKWSAPAVGVTLVLVSSGA